MEMGPLVTSSCLGSVEYETSVMSSIASVPALGSNVIQRKAHHLRTHILTDLLSTSTVFFKQLPADSRVPNWRQVGTSWLDMSPKVVFLCFEGLKRCSRRVWRRFVHGSREISLVSSLLRVSTDALI